MNLRIQSQVERSIHTKPVFTFIPFFAPLVTEKQSSLTIDRFCAHFCTEIEPIKYETRLFSDTSANNYGSLCCKCTRTNRFGLAVECVSQEVGLLEK